MDDLLKNAIDEHTSYGILALYGPSGVGKSTGMKRIAERCREEEQDSSVVPVVIVQASPEDVGSAARLDFYRQVLHQLRGHVAVRDRILNLPLAGVRGKKSTDPAEWLEMRDAVSYALDLLKVKAVGIDEAQHLMQADATQKPSIQLDWLKSLTNRSNLLYILLGNFSLYDFCHLNGQIARRVREEQFCRYHLDQQDDAVEFTSALKVLLEQGPLQVNIPEMLMHWKWFGEWSIGCIGILSDWVGETASTLCRAGETVLTLEALAKHALKPAQRLKLETEARTGEFKHGCSSGTRASLRIAEKTTGFSRAGPQPTNGSISGGRGPSRPASTTSACGGGAISKVRSSVSGAAIAWRSSSYPARIVGSRLPQLLIIAHARCCRDDNRRKDGANAERHNQHARQQRPYKCAGKRQASEQKNTDHENDHASDKKRCHMGTLTNMTQRQPGPAVRRPPRIAPAAKPVEACALITPSAL
jgi:AAA domain